MLDLTNMSELSGIYSSDSDIHDQIVQVEDINNLTCLGESGYFAQVSLTLRIVQCVVSMFIIAGKELENITHSYEIAISFIVTQLLYLTMCF